MCESVPVVKRRVDANTRVGSGGDGWLVRLKYYLTVLHGVDQVELIKKSSLANPPHTAHSHTLSLAHKTLTLVEDTLAPSS